MAAEHTAAPSADGLEQRGSLVAPDAASPFSFDNFHYSAGFAPEIPSLSQDIVGISGAAAAMLVERLAWPKNEATPPPPPRLVRFAPTLIVRASCAPV